MLSCKLKNLFHIAAEPSQKEVDDFVCFSRITKKSSKNFIQEHSDSINRQDRFGYTALTRVIGYTGMESQDEASEKKDIAEMLLNAGADPNMKTNEYTPLAMAAAHNDLPMVQLLLDHGADPNYQNRMGDTALGDACLHPEKETVELLLQRGANPEDKDAMVFAALHASLETVQLFLDRNVAPDFVEKTVAALKKCDKLSAVPMLERWLKAVRASEKAEFLADTDCSKPLARAIAVPRKLQPIRAGMAATA